MSTPVGQSDAQPLQARQRSSASATAGSAKPADQRAVDRLLQHPRRGRGWSPSRRGSRGRTGTSRRWSTARRTCRRRCSGAPRRRGCRRRAASRSSGATGSRGRTGRRSASSGAGSTRLPGLSRLSGSQIALTAAKSAQRLRVVHQRQQLGAGPAVAVLARQRAAVVAQLERARGEEVAEHLARAPCRARLEREVDAHVHAAVAEVAVGHAVEAVLAQQLVEVAQPGAEPLGRDGGVLPAGVGRRRRGCGRPARRRPRGSATAPPPRAASVDQPVVERAGRVGDRPARSRSSGASARRPRRTASRRPRGSSRHRAPARPDQVDDPGVQPLAGDQPPAAPAASRAGTASAASAIDG